MVVGVLLVALLFFVFSANVEYMYGSGGGESWNGRRRSYRPPIEGEIQDPDSLPMFMDTVTRPVNK